MARQLQLRRGTTAENDAFTGALGEVTVDTEAKKLRVHDGVTAGGYIVGDMPRTNDLFDFKWSDYEVADVRWLKADTFSWQDGSVYEAAYQHLVNDKNGAFDAPQFSTFQNTNIYGEYNNVCWGVNKFIALSRNGWVTTTTDGTSWTTATQVTNLGDRNWVGLVYTGTKFVALSSGGYISTSTDGTTWTAASLNISGAVNCWRALTYTGVQFVALSAKGHISTSTNGTTWSTPVQDSNLSSETNVWSAMTYGDSKFIAFRDGGYFSTSTDGTTWSTPVLAFEDTSSYLVRDIIYDGIKFITILTKTSPTWTQCISISFDGITWSPLTFVTNQSRFSGIAYSGTKYLISLTYHPSSSDQFWFATADGIIKTENITGVTISYAQAADGHKICHANQEQAVSQIYNTTGVAWYYILDTENQRFKLPRTKFNVTGLRDKVGDYVEPGLPNITGVTGTDVLTTSFTNLSGAFYGTTQNTSQAGNSWGNGYHTLNFDASRSNSIYGNNTTVQPPATQMYLYFYVGDFTATALENTAGVTTATLNNKLDRDHSNDTVPYLIETYISSQGDSWYRLYSDGWVEQGGHINALGYEYTATVNLPIVMRDANYTLTGGELSDVNGVGYHRHVVVGYDKTTTNFKSILPDSGQGKDWRVSGMAAV